MCELLDLVAVIVNCNTCNSKYSVPASNIRESHHVLKAGTTGSSSYECQACYYASLVEPDVVEALARAWAAFRQSATSHGGVDVVVRVPEPHPEPRAQPHADRLVSDDIRSIRRWENEGGH